MRITFLNHESRIKRAFITLENNYGIPYLYVNPVMSINCQFGGCHLGRKSKSTCHCLHLAYWTCHNAGLQQPNLWEVASVESTQIYKCTRVSYSCLLWMYRRRYVLRFQTQKGQKFGKTCRRSSWRKFLCNIYCMWKSYIWTAESKQN